MTDAESSLNLQHRGLIQRFKAAGAELVYVTGPRDRDSPCLDWVGAVISLTGAVKGLPTLAQAVEDGLFHPGCRHSLALFEPKRLNRARVKEHEANTLHAIAAMKARAAGKTPPPLPVRRYIQELERSKDLVHDLSENNRRKFERVYESARKARAGGDTATFRLKCRAALDILQSDPGLYGPRQAQLMAMLEARLAETNAQESAQR